MADRPRIVQKLEDILATALQDYNLHALAGGITTGDSAIGEYDRLAKDGGAAIGIKYLALHSVAMKHGLYIDKRDQQEMLGTVSQGLGNMSPKEVLQGIQYLKSNYPAIYQSDAVGLDRIELNAVEFITRLPMAQQDKVVLDAKNVQLNVRPIEPEPIKIPIIATQPVAPVTQAYTTQNYSPQLTQTYFAEETLLPTQNTSNKSTLIIGGSIIAFSIFFSTILLSKQLKPSTNTSNTNTPSKTTLPTSGASDSASTVTPLPEKPSFLPATIPNSRDNSPVGSAVNTQNGSNYNPPSRHKKARVKKATESSPKVTYYDTPVKYQSSEPTKPSKQQEQVDVADKEIQVKPNKNLPKQVDVADEEVQVKPNEKLHTPVKNKPASKPVKEPDGGGVVEEEAEKPKKLPTKPVKKPKDTSNDNSDEKEPAAKPAKPARADTDGAEGKKPQPAKADTNEVESKKAKPAAADSDSKK
jgi:hypothetical protein